MDRMNRLNRLNQIWSWLPAFRAVAETENLQEASDKIHTSPPALSRSIGLLEETVGTELFDREGRGLTLNEHGERFLETVRRSMRLLDEGLTSIRLEEAAAELHLAFHPRLEWMARHSNSPLVREGSDEVVHVSPGWASNVEQKLRSGELDLVFDLEPVRDEALTSTKLGTLESGLYGGAREKTEGAAEDREDGSSPASNRAFVVPNRALGTRCDGWPADREREIGMRASQLHLVERICCDRGLRAVLPKRYVEEITDGDELVELDVDGLEVTEVHALHRASIEEGPDWSPWLDGFARCL